MTYKQFKWWFAGLIVFATIIFCFNLGKLPFIDYDEATYAQVTDYTVSTNDIGTLKIAQNSPWFEKPPLYFWTAMFSHEIFSSPEFAYRLPAAMSGVVGVALVVLITLELGGGFVAALLSGFILLSTGLYLEAGRQFRLDVPVTATILLAYYSFLRGRRQAVWLWGIGISIGLGLMLKSVIGLFPLIVISLHSVFCRDYAWLKKRQVWYGLLAGAIIVIPWHIQQSLRYSQRFWNDYLLYHILKRFSGNILGAHRSNINYIDDFYRYAAPWTLAFLAGSVALFLTFKNSVQRKHLIVVATTVYVIITIFFISRTKLTYYFVPIFPFIAIFCGLLAVELYKKLKNKTVLYVALSIALIWATYNIFFVGYAYHPVMRFNIDLAIEEKAVGQIAAQYNTPDIYMLVYNYYESVRYYSNKKVITLQQNMSIPPAILVVLPTHLYLSSDLPKILKEHMQTLYQGEYISLVILDQTKK